MRNHFLLSQIFQGDVEFKESRNASLLVHISAQEKELERVKVEYNLLDRASIVDIQVVSYTIFHICQSPQTLLTGLPGISLTKNNYYRTLL